MLWRIRSKQRILESQQLQWRFLRSPRRVTIMGSVESSHPKYVQKNAKKTVETNM
jgi:hypothetical protein